MTDPLLPIVVGCPRSGTTLLRVMLDTHPDLAVAPDAPHLVALVGHPRRTSRLAPETLADRLARNGSFGGRVPVETLRNDFTRDPPTTLSDAVRRSLRSYAQYSGRTHAGIKTPVFVYHLRRLSMLLPEARFVHIIRDGRDVAASMLARDHFTDDVVMAASMWRRAILAARRASLGPERYLEVRYEQLVASPVTVLTEICAFLGLAFDERMLAYTTPPLAASLPGRFATLHDGLSRPPTVGLRDWSSELDREDLTRFDVVAGRVLEELGYLPTGLPIGPAMWAGTRARACLASARQRWDGRRPASHPTPGRR